MEGHFFDLDYTLWETNGKVWLLDKYNPKTYLKRLTKSETDLIMSGYYKNDNLEINYNGYIGWISVDLFNKLRKKRSSLKIEDIGLSFREFSDPELLQEQTKNLILNVHHIKHLKNESINLLTARGSKNAHKDLINKLNTLLPDDITIDKEYFVNDKTEINIKGTQAEKKAIILLQHLIGYKINYNKFEPILVDSYDTIHFYDDEDLNILACKKINKYLKDILEKTQPWIVSKIKDKIKLNNLVLNINKVTSNEINPFEKDIINITVD